MIETITPSNINYNELRQQWNRAIQKYPKAIAYCKSYQDVKTAVLFATKHHLKIRIRSGGHHYEGYSIANDAYVIDLSNLNQIKINHEKNTVTVQGGATIGQLYNFISAQNYPFPGGSCPTVGVSGFALGGGWGYSARYLGLGCDSLVEIKLINYKGCLMTANKRTNSDLFWACKGAGGGNFGVVVSMTFKLPKKVDQVTQFNIIYPNALKKTQLQFLNTWQNWITTTSTKINMKGSIIHSKTEGMSILCTGLFYGSPKELQTLLRPFTKITENYQITYEFTSFLQAVQLIESVYPQYEYFHSVGRFINKQLSYQELKELLRIINSPLPPGSTMTLLNVYGLGGKVSEVKSTETAFYYRDSRYIMLLESDFKDNDYNKANFNWVYENSKYLNQMSNGSFINFPFAPTPDYLEAYYGNNVRRLKRIKRKYDPLNIFNFPQGIN